MPQVCAQVFAKMNLFLFLLISVSFAQREARHKKFDRTTEEMIEEFEREVPKITLGKGTNMGSNSDAKSIQSEVAAKIGSQYVGVAVNIQNYSPFLLTDVHKHVEYGWPVRKTLKHEKNGTNSCFSAAPSFLSIFNKWMGSKFVELSNHI